MELATTITVRGPGGEEILDLEEFESRIEQGAVDPATEVCFPPLTGQTFVRAIELESFRSLYQPRALYFSRAFTLGRIPWLTLALALANLGIFLLQQRAGPIDTAALVAFGAKAGPLIHDLGELWRLLTANFVHRDWAHVGFNLFVLFHFGAALENAYRPLDFLLVLVASALGTTLLSLAATDAVSFGASGVAFGMLGGVAVFGLKYWKILPDRYRSVLGPAVLPTVLVFLYLGWSSSGVDNWGHTGGLLAGALATAPLQPRLLEDSPTPRRLLARLAPLVAVVAGLFAAEPLLEERLPILERQRLDHLALELPVPTSWVGVTPSSWSNGLAAPVRASMAAGARLLPMPPDLEAEARRWMGEEEGRLTASGKVETRFSAIEEVEVGGLPGVVVRASLRAEGVHSEVEARFFARGRLLHSLVLARPASLPDYGRVFERIVAGVQPIEPRKR